MGKKRKIQVFVLKPWCWYCEREFEDDKVLLQHQKSKHFKCQLCPRKLNTAGGLMVHSQQVHKCEPEPLTNTLPGRDGYEIEIFGMEGVPTNALAEWKARKEAEVGAANLAAAAQAKRPRFRYTVIPEADLMAALTQHKAIMAQREIQAAKAAQAAADARAKGLVTHNMAIAGQQGPVPVPVPAPGPVPAPAPGLGPMINQSGAPVPFPGATFPPMPRPTLGSAPPFPGTLPFRPPFPPNGAVPPFLPTSSPLPPGLAARPPPPPSSFLSPNPPILSSTPTPLVPGGLSTPLPGGSVSATATPPVPLSLPKDGVFWSDNDASPAEKRVLQPRYRYTSPPPSAPTGPSASRKAAADFL